MAKILVIDDDKHLRSSFRRTLTAIGHDVITAEDGLEGLKKIEESPVDLVITDVFMPRREGIETLITLKKRDPDQKVFVMSGGGRVGNMDFLDAAKSFGADEVLVKPFKIDVLLAAIKRANI